MEGDGLIDAGDRRRVERRGNASLADVTLPELRRIVLTWGLTLIVVALFLWMVREVLIAAILAIVIAVYLFFALLAAAGTEFPFNGF